MLPTAAQRAVDMVVPKLNPMLANGLAVRHMKDIEPFIDSIFRSVAPSFPPGLVYLGSKRCDPLQEFNQTTRQTKNRRSFNIARSYMSMVEYSFEFNGEPIRRYLQIPFVDDAGTIYISGSRFVISPVLADRVISIGLEDVFVRVFKTKLTIKREAYYYVADGHQEDVHVAYSRIHNNKPTGGGKTAIKLNHTLMHYLLCKYGFSGVFERFCGFKPVIGYQELENKELYPQKDWVICRSSQKLRSLRSGLSPTEIRIAIPREKYTPSVKNLVCGFYYVADKFPHRVQVEYVENTALWMLLLAHGIWPGDHSEGKLYQDITIHFQSLDIYLDAYSSEKLKEINLPCKDIYELFFTIIDRFTSWMLTSPDRVSTMYDKELNVLMFVCSDFINAINHWSFKLTSASNKELTYKSVVGLMNQYLKTGIAYKLKDTHGEVSTTSTSGDNKALKITHMLVPQTKSTKRTKSGAVALDDPSLRLHVSIAEVGGCFSMSKSAPDGRSRLNLYLQVGPTGLVIRNEELRPLTDSVQELIRR